MEFNIGSNPDNEPNHIPQSQQTRYSPLRSLTSLVIVGVIFIIAGYFILQSFKIDPNWKKINGTVVSVDTSTSTDSDGSSSTTYAPVVEYKVDGQSYLKKSSVSSSSIPSIGSTKTVAYNPNNPGDAKIVESTGTKLLFLIFPIAGAGCLVFASFLFIRGKKNGSSKFQSTPLIPPPPMSPPGTPPPLNNPNF